MTPEQARQAIRAAGKLGGIEAATLQLDRFGASVLVACDDCGAGAHEITGIHLMDDRVAKEVAVTCYHCYQARVNRMDRQRRLEDYKR